MSKLLIAIQYWEGDKAQAMRVAQLMADLEPRHNSDVDFLFSARFDCAHDMKAVEKVSAKFKVWTYVNKHRRGVGWPSGCNDLWFGTLDHIYDFGSAKFMPTYDAILTCEADSSPLGPHWHRTLMNSWRTVNETKIVKVHGAMVRYPAPHINGNALFSGDLGFLHRISRQIGGCSPIHGWDFILCPQFKQAGWANCPHIRSEWQCKTMAPEQIDGYIDAGVSFLHGVKDDSVLEHVRRRFVH